MAPARAPKVPLAGDNPTARLGGIGAVWRTAKDLSHVRRAPGTTRTRSRQARP